MFSSWPITYISEERSSGIAFACQGTSTRKCSVLDVLMQFQISACIVKELKLLTHLFLLVRYEF